jgi:hypothetical protein
MLLFKYFLDTCLLTPECIADPNFMIRTSPLEGHPSNHIRRKRSTLSTAEIEKYVANENQQLAEYQMRINSNQIYPIPPDTQRLEILHICKDIVAKAIPKSTFPTKLLEDSFQHFNYLFFEKDIDDMSDKMFGDITYALGQCLDQARPFNFKLSKDCPPVVSF